MILLKLLPYVLFTVPLAAEVVVSYRMIILKHKVVNHKQDTFVRAALLIIMSIVDAHFSGVHWWQSFLLSIGWYWLIFDYSINLVTNQYWSFLGSTSWLDQQLNKTDGYIILFMKIWFFLLCIGVYYHLDWIVNGYHKL